LHLKDLFKLKDLFNIEDPLILKLSWRTWKNCKIQSFI